jgi:uncharacterized cupredoxin-like copper-binding protein
MRTIRPYVRWLRRSAHFSFVLALAVFTSSAEAQTQVNPRRPRSAPSSADELCTIASTEFKFTQPSTPIVAGRPVTIVLNNRQGETEHSIVVPALGLRILARAGEVVKKDYTFETPGEYEFVCDLPGHEEAGMKGKLSVIMGDGAQAKGHGAMKK